MLYFALIYLVTLFIFIQIILYIFGLNHGRFFNYKKFLEDYEKGLRKLYRMDYSERIK
jgi:hypothetical protein